jgi:hypothetical protein
MCCSCHCLSIEYAVCVDVIDELVPVPLAASGSALVGNVGRIEVKALDWSQPEQREAFADTKWDYILAAGGFSGFCIAPCTFSH